MSQTQDSKSQKNNHTKRKEESATSVSKKKRGGKKKSQPQRKEKGQIGSVKKPVANELRVNKKNEKAHDTPEKKGKKKSGQKVSPSYGRH